MYAAKCMTVLIVLAGLAVMWVLYRKKTNQILLAIALTIFVGGVLRLFQIKDNDQTLHTVGVIMLALGLVWVVSWVSNRSATRRVRR
jgi:hypothetical protein